MAKLRLLIELDYDAAMWEGDLGENRDWFNEEVLRGPNLILHDNEVGDDIGTVRVLDIPGAEPGTCAESTTPATER